MIGERIKELRKILGLTQQGFAEKVGIKRNSVATYETGKSNVGDPTVTLICNTFNVNEDWLRNGVGEPFRPATKEEQVKRLIAKATGLSDNFKEQFAATLSSLTYDDWQIIIDMANELANIKKHEAELRVENIEASCSMDDSQGLSEDEREILRQYRIEKNRKAKLQA